MSNAADTCPNCNSSFPSDALICVQCGFDRRTGTQVQTKSTVTAPRKKTKLDEEINQLKDSLLSAGADLGDVAKKTWRWLTRPGVIAALILGQVLLIFHLAFYIAICVIGIASIIGFGWLLLEAFDEDAMCLVLMLFIPFYYIYFMVTRWENCNPFLTVGAVVLGQGYMLISLAVHTVINAFAVAGG